jgi:hypothetical protein
MVCSKRRLRGNINSIRIIKQYCTHRYEVSWYGLGRCINKPLIVVDWAHGIGDLYHEIYEQKNRMKRCRKS